MMGAQASGEFLVPILINEKTAMNTDYGRHKVSLFANYKT